MVVEVAVQAVVVVVLQAVVVLEVFVVPLTQLEAVEL